ncbi:hypothetical protein [Deinococcus sp.]|uniref:hypothetical protein n=1 Tax=Deinococcus sp. TaxID=47478 RepID=UPI003CC55620
MTGWNRFQPSAGAGLAQLTLWAAVLLFAIQGGLHAAMPAGMSMPQMIAGLFQSAAGPGGAPDEMAGMTPGQTPSPQTAPLRPASHLHSAEGLCCMPPLALVEAFWVPPQQVAVRLRQTPPKALCEARLILRATARGPPLRA